MQKSGRREEGGREEGGRGEGGRGEGGGRKGGGRREKRYPFPPPPFSYSTFNPYHMTFQTKWRTVC